jgi:hypothetical protein
VTLALMSAVIGAAGEHSGKLHPMARLVGPALASTVGPRVAASTAKQVRKGFEKAHRPDPAGPCGPAEAPGTGTGTGENEEGAEGAGGLADAPTPLTLSEFASDFGVRPPPDPEALYRSGYGPVEPLFPMPGGLASLPWNSLSHRDRFFVLVAAWALREADGIQLLRAGDFGPANQVFQECVARAKQMQSAELIARSYEDLAEHAAASGNGGAARVWRAAAAHERQQEQQETQEGQGEDQ